MMDVYRPQTLTQSVIKCGTYSEHCPLCNPNHRWAECECGDLRDQHVNNEGACVACSCQKFALYGGDEDAT